MAPMNKESRRAVVANLLQLADSPDYQDRADAGRAMASFVEMPETRVALQQLLLDADDTFVTRVTAEALLQRHDAPGLAAVAQALASADANHGDWLHTAIVDVFMIYASERDVAVRTCEALIEGGDLPVARGAARVRDILTQINPVLRPVDKQ
jgi:hypothetical protein